MDSIAAPLAAGTRVGARAIPTAASVATAALILLAGALAADTVSTVFRLRAPLPFLDEWDSFTLYRMLMAGDERLSALVSPHNEHRIFIPRLILFSDYLFFGGRGILNLVSIFAIQVAQVVMLIGLLRAGRPRSLGSLAIGALVVILLFSLKQWENFIWGFQVQFVGVFALASLGMICFARALSEQRRSRSGLSWLAGAYVAAFAATFSMANGMLAGLVMVALAFTSRATWRVTMTTCAVAAALIGSYSYGLELPTNRTPPADAILHHFGKIVPFTAIYIGNLLGPSVSACRPLGFCGIAILILAAVRSFLGRDATPARLAPFGIMLFCVGSGFVTAVGRFDFGMGQALAGRYLAGSTLFWAAALIYGWSVAADLRRPVLLEGAVVLFGAVLLFGALQAQHAVKAGIEDWSYKQAQSADMLLSGLTEGEALMNTHDEVGTIHREAAFLKEQHLSLYRGPDGELDRQPIAQAGRIVDRSACHGAINLAVGAPEIGPSGVDVSGYAWALHHLQLTGRIYLVDDRNTIVGFASQNGATKDRSAWHGVAVGTPGTRLAAFARLSGGRLCDLGGATVSTRLPPPP